MAATRCLGSRGLVSFGSALVSGKRSRASFRAPTGDRGRTASVRGIGDFLGKVMGKGSSVPRDASEAEMSEGGGVDQALARSVVFIDNAPTWDELKEMLRHKSEEVGFAELDPETGPTNAKALLRMFGHEGEPRIKLYRDHAAWCPYCHKVWLLLEEKRVPYRVEKINMRCYGDKPAEFMAKVPSGLLPVLEIDGNIITESERIMFLIEDMYTEPAGFPSMLPAKGSDLRAHADVLLKLERRMFSVWLNWLCSDYNQVSGKRMFEEGLAQVEQALARAQQGSLPQGESWEVKPGPYFLGERISMVDLVFAPFLERMVASLLYYKGYRMRGEGRYPALESWFRAMESRETYRGTRSDHFTHCHDLPPQLGGCGMTEEGLPYAAMIDGLAPGAWRLPLEPLSETSLEAWSPGDHPGKDCVEAASRLIGNNAAITRFCLRGIGKRGPRPVMAPLSDPTAIPDMSQEAEVDAMLRHVAHALLVGTDSKQESATALECDVAGEEATIDNALSAYPIPASLGYLRDRVGVPRDMSFPAARQLRAHLNWAIDLVKSTVPA